MPFGFPRNSFIGLLSPASTNSSATFLEGHLPLDFLRPSIVAHAAMNLFCLGVFDGMLRPIPTPTIYRLRHTDLTIR